MRGRLGTAVAAVAALAVWAGGVCAQERVRLSGYGEMHYNVPSEGETSRLDFHRLVLGFAYRFNESVSFEAELDFEHAFTEPELEFAHLDFYYREALSFRTGVMLMPVGPLNESHEPPLFYSVERPYIHKHIIPTTWQEPGAGGFGTVVDGALRYRVYMVGGLDASEFHGSDGIRKGRQRGANAAADDLAVVGRVEYAPTLRLSLGASGYHGGAAQGDAALGDAAVTMGEVDGLVRVAGFELRAMYVHAFTAGADSISINGNSGSTVGKEMAGFYGEVAYHVLHAIGGQSARDIIVFARFEDYDTHHRVPDGFERDPSYDRRLITTGISYLPGPSVALKADVELWEDGSGARREQGNLGFGFMF